MCRRHVAKLEAHISCSIKFMTLAPGECWSAVISPAIKIMEKEKAQTFFCWQQRLTEMSLMHSGYEVFITQLTDGPSAGRTFFILSLKLEHLVASRSDTTHHLTVLSGTARHSPRGEIVEMSGTHGSHLLLLAEGIKHKMRSWLAKGAGSTAQRDGAVL